MGASIRCRSQLAIERAAVLLGVLTGLVCTRPSRLAGQQLELRPLAGLQLPTRVSLRGDGLHVRQQLIPFVGVRLDVVWSSRFDVATDLKYVPGSAILRGSNEGIDLGTSAHLLSLATRARYWLLPPTGRLAWEVHTGVGAGFGGTQEFGDLFDHSLLSGGLATVLRYQVLRWVSVHVEVRERLFRVRLGGDDLGSSRRPLRISFGVGLPLGGS